MMNTIVLLELVECSVIVSTPSNPWRRHDWVVVGHSPKLGALLEQTDVTIRCSARSMDTSDGLELATAVNSYWVGVRSMRGLVVFAAENLVWCLFRNFMRTHVDFIINILPIELAGATLDRLWP
jgi:hypothetical protein